MRSGSVTNQASRYDPQFAVAFERLHDRIGDVPTPSMIDVRGLREASTRDRAAYRELLAPATEVTWRSFAAPRADSSSLEMRWCTNDAVEEPGSAWVYLHGGGMIMSDLDVYAPRIGRYVQHSGVPVLAVEYRLAPEHPYPAALADCLDALDWLHVNAERLGVDRTRIGVMGDSGGGTIAAAAAIAARDTGAPLIAAQLLVYPMLDDRTRTTPEAIAPWVTWTAQNNVVAWDAVLGALTQDPAPTAAPARATDMAGLPRCYMEVGDLDLFLPEDLDYAQRLSAAGVGVELHVHPGVPHAFEVVAPDIDVSRRALADRYRMMRSI